MTNKIYIKPNGFNFFFQNVLLHDQFSLKHYELWCRTSDNISINEEALYKNSFLIANDETIYQTCNLKLQQIMSLNIEEYLLEGFVNEWVCIDDKGLLNVILICQSFMLNIFQSEQVGVVLDLFSYIQ